MGKTIFQNSSRFLLPRPGSVVIASIPAVLRSTRKDSRRGSTTTDEACAGDGGTAYQNARLTMQTAAAAASAESGAHQA